MRKDRGYFRLKYMEGDEVKDVYFGKDKEAALKEAIVIIDLKIHRWEKRRKEYLDELQAIEDGKKEPIER